MDPKERRPHLISTDSPVEMPTAPTTPTVSTPTSQHSSRPLPPTIITDPSALNDNSRNETPRVMIFDSSRDSSAPPTPSSAVSNEFEMTSTTLKPPTSPPHENIIPHNDPKNPFAFTPAQLSSLIDPKNLLVLRGLGGLDGLFCGLHSDPNYGLSIEESAPFEPVRLQDILDKRVLPLDISKNSTKTDIVLPLSVPDAKYNSGLVATTNQTVSKLSETALIEPSAEVGVKKAGVGLFAQRKAVFGVNVLPEVPTKNIFQLMWMALQDKILVFDLFVYFGFLLTVFLKSSLGSTMKRVV